MDYSESLLELRRLTKMVEEYALQGDLQKAMNCAGRAQMAAARLMATLAGQATAQQAQNAAREAKL